MIGAFQLGVIAAGRNAQVTPAAVAFVAGATNATYSSDLRHVISNSSWATVPLSIDIPTSGKWYTEFVCDPGYSAGNGPMIGVIQSNTPQTSYLGGSGPDSASIGVSSVRVQGSAWSALASTGAGTSGQIVGVLVDMGTGSIRWSINGGVLSDSIALVDFPPGLPGLRFAISSHPAYGGVAIATTPSYAPSGYTWMG